VHVAELNSPSVNPKPYFEGLPWAKFLCAPESLVFRRMPSDSNATGTAWPKMSRVLASVAVFAALPTYLALGARLWWVFDLATHFCVFYVVALLPTAIALLVFKRWRLLALVTVALAINISLLAPLYFRDSFPTGNPSLRVVSLNVLFENSHHDRVLDFIRQESPDLVLLLEVDSSWQPALETLESQFSHSLFETSKGSFGIALFSQLPLENLQRIEIGSTGIPSITATVRLAGTPVQIVGTHFMSPMSNRRSRLRNEQLISTAHEMAQISRPSLLLGDLNITPWSPFFRDLLKLGKLHNSQTGFGIQPSWMASLPIDHLLHSDEIVILDRRIGPYVGSDHRPLIVEFAVKKSAN